MKLCELVEEFRTQERDSTNLVDEETLLSLAVSATRLYAGYAEMQDSAAPVSGETDVTNSEWAVIRPLFLLYVDRESATQLESCRIMGVDTFGRTSSEVSVEIAQAEADLPKKAFSQPIFSL